jgi:membrane protein implicated in regulation of membrane protease activity
VSAVLGLVLGLYFSWMAIAICSVGLAVVSAAALQIQGFGALPGITIVVACLAVNQLAYLAGAFHRSKGLFQKQADKEPSRRRNNNIAGEPHQQQKSPSSFV